MMPSVTMRPVTLADVRTALRRFWPLAIGVLVLVAGLGVLGAVLPETRYQSTAAVNVVPADEEAFSFGAVQAVEFLVPPVLTRVESPLFEQGVRQRLPGPLRDAPVSLSATNDPGTGIIEIEVESSSSSAAVTAAGLAVQRLTEFPRSELIRITALNPPTPADALTARRRVPVIAGSAVLGLILATLASVAAHRLKPEIPRAQEFEERYGHTVLGEIPRRREMPTQSAAVFNGTGTPDILEAFRSLQTAFIMRHRRLREGHARGAVAVTSWSGGEGKTTVTANLAWALAASGHEVAVVDCDLRRPRVHELLGVSAERGVADVARGASVASVIQETALDKLLVVSAGAADRHPSETVHHALAILLGVLNDRLVLIDTPPMFAAETTEIADAVGGLLLVADVRQRAVDEIGEALGELDVPGTPVLGVILNRVRPTNQRGELSYYYAGVESRRPAAREP